MSIVDIIVCRQMQLEVTFVIGCFILHNTQGTTLLPLTPWPLLIPLGYNYAPFPPLTEGYRQVCLPPWRWYQRKEPGEFYHGEMHPWAFWPPWRWYQRQAPSDFYIMEIAPVLEFIFHLKGDIKDDCCLLTLFTTSTGRIIPSPVN